MKRILAITLAAIFGIEASAQINFPPTEHYLIGQSDIDRAEALLDTPLKKAVKYPNPSKGARWFPDASLGLFMHWGIHSMLGAQPSWAMINHYRYNGGYKSKELYYGQALEFNPEFPADKYLTAAREAGFNYAVLTTRHHDGYCLWPSKYGIGTKQFMGGRDLIKEYVEACRRAGLRVGLYYSPRDWLYPGTYDERHFDANTRSQVEGIKDPVLREKEYVRMLGYVMAQIEELLTNYGKIDILWLDGMDMIGVTDHHNDKIYAWIRSLQPDIVVNDRWHNIVDPDNPDGTSVRVGDFTTPFECRKPTYSPSEWWEHCHIWTCGGGGWGYDKTGTFRPMSWFFDEYVASRSLGGNFLPNASPDGNGEMHPNFYRQTDSLKAWMSHSAESLNGAGPTPGARLSNVPLTTRGKRVWYAHLLPSFKGQVSVLTNKKPKSVTLLRTGEPILYEYACGAVIFNLSSADRTKTDDVVKIIF